MLHSRSDLLLTFLFSKWLCIEIGIASCILSCLWTTHEIFMKLSYLPTKEAYNKYEPALRPLRGLFTFSRLSRWTGGNMLLILWWWSHDLQVRIFTSSQFVLVYFSNQEQWEAMATVWVKYWITGFRPIGSFLLPDCQRLGCGVCKHPVALGPGISSGAIFGSTRFGQNCAIL